jgi:diketogulonate reductase-like aldo/keto reductase
MIHREIQGTRVPMLGFGTWQLEGDACRDGVAHALALGYRHIDTAQGYDNEAFVGQALAASGVPRDEIFLVTKLRPSNFHADDAIRSTKESLAKLRSAYVDLLLLHWPNPDVPVEETLGALRVLQDEGLVRHLGVSNFPPSLTARANDAQRIFANQVEYHPFLHQRTLRAQAEELDLMLTAYSPLAKGAVLKDPVLQEIGAAHGKTPVQVTLRWLLQQDRVSAIPKAASAEHREANLDVFDFELSPEEMTRIHDLEREERIIDPAGGPDWERD